MPGIWIAALLTSLLALSVIGGWLWKTAPREERTWLLFAVLAQLPMCGLAFYGVRQPLDAWVRDGLGAGSEAYRFARVLYAPVTEELAKLWPLVLLSFRQRLTPGNLTRAGVALGLGFGVGEMWMVAGRVANNPAVAGLPWYMFGGYLGERFMVCICHGAFTATALRGLRLWRAPGRGVWAAMGLHGAGNFPIYLASRDFGKWGELVWQVLLGLWLIAFFAAMFGLLAYYAYGKGWLQALLGTARCRGCGREYPRPWWSLNCVTHRLDRCPHCGRWNWTRA